MMGDIERLSHENFAGYRKQQKRNRNLHRKLKTEMHSRFAMAGSCFLFVLLGAEFVGIYAAIKREEFETFMTVISAWEREYLLLNV